MVTPTLARLLDHLNAHHRKATVTARPTAEPSARLTVPPTPEQLLILADRAESKGGLSAAEAARLRAGIERLAALSAGRTGVRVGPVLRDGLPGALRATGGPR